MLSNKIKANYVLKTKYDIDQYISDTADGAEIYNNSVIDDYLPIGVSVNNLMVNSTSASSANSATITTTQNTGSSLNLNGSITYNPANWNIPTYSYSGYNYKIPSSVYTEEKVTKKTLDGYANDSFIFDKATKVMLYKDENGDIFIQNAFRKVSMDDIERELALTEKESLLQKEIDDYFRD